MNNQDPNSRIRRYDFSESNQNHEIVRKKFNVLPWIIGLIVTVVAIVCLINVVTGNSANNLQLFEKNQISKKANSDKKLSRPQTKKHSKPEKNISPFAYAKNFNSVEDAQNWANAMQDNWLADGYNNYTITQDGQGYYVLKFIK
ncbi:hypothetical protein GSH19_00770 [Lactobacillus sp. S2-2]|uniref:hypothetical protein n=1 Tax=Lactobacillus sp. S2-2 TaxID=2692917 RepID=UPI001F29C8F2|nr:hypothetical protein [Lactobacillus sp. S2-2]MCF6514720.1 hypothetical protein [Lactobacillus sp. S2-2]